MNLNVVLVEPEIPQNTGNIARTCAAVGARLHLVKPLGFSVDDRHLKRAGLDYWHLLDIQYYDNIEHFFKVNKGGNFFYATTKAVNIYSDITYPDNCFLVFGKETAGLPEELLKDNKDRCIRIPMIEGARSLNLSNSVAIIVYEALRQKGFESLKGQGNLTKFEW
ncbi:MAG: tRNA ((34)/cytosine(34)/5-carboxymethylaminomethyluridine(34)-2-O)-methyltransferase TrmL [Clostridia bacterium]|jgi:tRNA (cytidine/uridine-2'-O-)-methyltransferase|uniref:tRNA (uridine(34)/cytosine(34)/5- carboxymethylaminomethyluridine(34)-2'-O)- methyltransferase TrmL n=1 Tax=Petroclostridium xylanilyticum TaxID=1792311 RepID=UPI000B988D79|nr:tRNA (uridine(34)/cytosine(34)/5-carboxymethylaminomethyluridine(34)-2'-O)-methyltransferase TrmL [Petroclostridium xylanilyticum]MBZ4646582.1 tRNA ((34)/cytosine(34)/5-carboxymethylaminomethyluridine(34)-2-O)-methyltransferase TrmL [Clostridia bacterium]